MARALRDATGTFLGVGMSHFCESRLYRDHRDRWERNLAYAARHPAFTYRRNFVLTGGWGTRRLAAGKQRTNTRVERARQSYFARHGFQLPARTSRAAVADPWEFAGAFLPWALEVLPVILDEGWQRFNLRSSLTIFDGFPQTPTFAEQQAVVRQTCAILKPRLHTLHDLQIANEYGPCGWDFPQGIEWLREHAKLARQLLGPNVIISISSRNATMNDERDVAKVFAEARALFGGLLPGIVTASVNHDSREVRLIDGPWRHVRQGWERVLHDGGTALEPDASIDDEPMGPWSSVAEERNVSRLVSKVMHDFVSGRCSYTFHPDAAIWSDLLHPDHKHHGMGAHRHIDDHPESDRFGQAVSKLVALLPPDLPNWNRTRHGLEGHPFGLSFERRGELYTQIWPDGITAHGVVRAYCAVRGNEFVCPLGGIRDRIDLRWDRPLEARLYSCATGDQVAAIASSARALTVPQSMDTDMLVIGRWV